MSLKVMQRIFSFVLVAGMLLGFVAPAGAQPSLGVTQKAPLLSAEKVEDLVFSEIEANGQTDFFVWMSVKADLSKAEELDTKLEKGQFVFETVRATAEQTQKNLRGYLDAQGITYRPYYIVNAIFVEGGDLDLALSLAARSDVSAITANHKFQLQEPFDMRPAGPVSPDLIEPNLTFINVDDVWAMGVMGEGTVMAGNDTGLTATHPAIARHYRGCLNPPTCDQWDHNYNWWDAWDEGNTTPWDDYGHGTHTTGTMVGDDGADNQIGVAPGAQTVHCKNMLGGGGDDAHFLECFEWDLAPWDLTGANPDPAMAPDAVNNSWGYWGGGVEAFRDAINTLQAAGVAVEVSAGNEGSGCQSLRSPGDYQEVLTTGSVDHTGYTFPGVVTGFSSRGPSVLDGNFFPDIMAPGNGIRSSVYANSYEYWSGTSMAGPHATALVGLIWSACPALQGDVETTYGIIHDTAEPLAGQVGSCGGDYDVGPNNDWGYGTINAEAAVQMALGMCAGMGALDGTVTDAVSGLPVADANVVMDWDGGGSWVKDTDENGYYFREVPIGLYDITVSHPFYENGVALGVEVITDTTTTQDFQLTPRGYLFGYVTDFDSGIPLEEATVMADDGTTDVTDADGFYEMYLDEGTYDVTASLENYAPGTETVEIVSGEDTQQDFALKGVIAFSPAPVEITLDMGATGFVDATLINRQPWEYAFEFMEKFDGFVPTILGGNTATAPEGYVPTIVRPTNGGVPLAGTVAIFKDANPWGSVATETILGMYGIPYEVHTSAEFGSLDFADYGMIVISGDQPTSFYDAYGMYVDKFEDYVAGGGFLNFFACDAGWNGGTLTDPLPGGITWTGWIYENYNDIVDPAHPVVAGVPNPFYGNYASHGHFTNLPAEAWVIAQEQVGGYPTIVELAIGGGKMIAYGQPLEISYDWGWDAGLIMVNTLLYGNVFVPSLDVPWFAEDPISGTVPASTTLPGEIDVTVFFTATTDVGVTQPGDYLATLKIKGDPSKDVPVKMTVNPPDTWGKIYGNVSSLGYCDDNPYPLEEAVVWMETNLGNIYSDTTDAAGDYQWWMDAAESPVDVSVDFPDHIGQEALDVVVVAGEETEVNFELRWNFPCVGATPDSLSSTLEWGDSSTQPMDITNGGAAELNFEIGEKDRGWMPALSIPAFEGTLPESDVPASIGLAPTQGVPNRSEIPYGGVINGVMAYGNDAYPTGDFVSFDTDVPGTFTIIANLFPGAADFLAGADFVNGDFSTLYALEFYGNVLDAIDTTTGDVTQIGPAVPGAGEQWTGAASSADGTFYAAGSTCSSSTLYTIDLDTGTPTAIGPVTNAPCLIAIAMNSAGELYGIDIVNDNFLSIDPATGEGTIIGYTGVDANYAQGMDFDEENALLYWASYSFQGELRIIDPTTGGSVLVGAFSGGDEVDGFATATGGVGPDVPWLSEDIITGTIPADGAQTVNVTMDSTFVNQPGDYYATLAIKSDDPINKTFNVPVTMTVLPADNMGKVTGMVWDNCLDNPLEEVYVSIAGGDPITMTLTGEDGMYTAWLVEGLYTIEFILDGYVTFSADVTIVAGETVVLDVALVPDRPCMETTPTIIEEWVLTNTEVYTFAGGFDITNNGAQDLEFELFELPPMALGGGIDSLSGSFVVFDPTIGGDEFYVPGTPQTFCFHTESFTNDWEYVYEIWMNFPDGWTVDNVSVVGTPSCTGGGYFDVFSWYPGSSPNEVDIFHPRYQAPTDHCVADYCVDVVSAPGLDAPVSWYWSGDGWGGTPHHPCSDDGYSPSGYPACDEAVYPPALVPAGSFDFPWFWADPVSGTVTGESLFNVGIYFSSISETIPLPVGDYSMTLMARGNDPVNPTIATPVIMHVVSEYVFPEASFEADASVCEDADLVFSNTTTIGVPPITWYEWDFGDGSTSTEISPTHVFADAGVYTVTLEACNREGCTTYSQPVEVLPKPEASFTFTSYSLEVTFNNTSLYGDSFLWDFGDGVTSTEVSPVHVFATEGPYTVTLWVYNECGVAMYEAVVTLDEVFIYILPLQYKALPQQP